MFYWQDMTPCPPCLANLIPCLWAYLSVHHPALSSPDHASQSDCWIRSRLINIACFVSHFLVPIKARVLSTFLQYPPPPTLLFFFVMAVWFNIHVNYLFFLLFYYDIAFSSPRTLDRIHIRKLCWSSLSYL